ncbi:galactokinase [Rudaeicoccus suwonensis]|uniref:Galactokinase n=1 Tax=Rudaeicoccus suwonensis TaxID=657409 RepID=A0A561E6S1_9MICO|nr:galactokinase [Rudaeicoccus suwonensis]TWE11313.1 galactokinase [Rudaeicoccus suwonensis]
MIANPPAVDVDALVARFSQLYDGAPDGVWAAPGRVNLIGEHTDYNGGFVLPIALQQHTVAVVRRREDAVVRVASVQVDDGRPVTVDLDDVAPGGSFGWAAYVVGVGWAARQRDLPVKGLDIVLASNVPTGAGLSSSAALSCGTARAWSDLMDWQLAKESIADLGRDAENHIAGAPTGLMDQLASVCGRAGQAMQIDTRAVTITHLPFELRDSRLSLLVIDSHTAHTHADGEYVQRRRACQEAAEQLGVEQLRDVPLAGLEQTLAPLSSLLRRRARHVVTDSARVEQVAALLQDGGDVRRIGPLLNDSHASMRDDFDITAPSVDALQRAAVDAGAYGARMTGGGFGGCVIALVDKDQCDAIAVACATAAAAGGFPAPTAFVAEAGDGAGRLR